MPFSGLSTDPRDTVTLAVAYLLLSLHAEPKAIAQSPFGQEYLNTPLYVFCFSFHWTLMCFFFFFFWKTGLSIRKKKGAKITTCLSIQ